MDRPNRNEALAIGWAKSSRPTNQERGPDNRGRKRHAHSKETAAEKQRDHAQQPFWTSCGEASFAARNGERTDQTRENRTAKAPAP